MIEEMLPDVDEETLLKGRCRRDVAEETLPKRRYRRDVVNPLSHLVLIAYLPCLGEL